MQPSQVKLSLVFVLYSYI